MMIVYCCFITGFLSESADNETICENGSSCSGRQSC